MRGESWCKLKLLLLLFLYESGNQSNKKKRECPVTGTDFLNSLLQLSCRQHELLLVSNETLGLHQSNPLHTSLSLTLGYASLLASFVYWLLLCLFRSGWRFYDILRSFLYPCLLVKVVGRIPYYTRLGSNPYQCLDLQPELAHVHVYRLSYLSIPGLTLYVV